VGIDGLTDRLIFASDQSGNLGSFTFTGFGLGAVQFDLGGGYWEITPVPEAGTYFSGSILLALICFITAGNFESIAGVHPGSCVFLERTARELHHKWAINRPGTACSRPARMTDYKL
jgi:hypothetical protein